MYIVSGDNNGDGRDDNGGLVRGENYGNGWNGAVCER